MTTVPSSSTSGSPNSAQRNNRPREGDEDQRPGRSATPQQAEAFAKLLRRKAGGDGEDAPNPQAQGLVVPPRPDLPPTPVPSPGPAGVTTVNASATADAMRCAQVHGTHAPAPLAGAAATPSSWEVRLGDPLAGGLQLRATSNGTAAAVVPTVPTWELSLSSSQLGAHTLARHAPRLSERLRSRGVDHDSVHVQGGRQHRPPQDESGDEPD